MIFYPPEDLRAAQDIVTGKIGGIVDPKAERMGKMALEPGIIFLMDYTIRSQDICKRLK